MFVRREEVISKYVFVKHGETHSDNVDKIEQNIMEINASKTK